MRALPPPAPEAAALRATSAALTHGMETRFWYQENVDMPLLAARLHAEIEARAAASGSLAAATTPLK